MAKWAREKMAAKAASEAAAAAQSEAPQVESSEAPKQEGRKPEPRNEPRRLAMEEIAKRSLPEPKEPVEEVEVKPKAEEPKIETAEEPKIEAKIEAKIEEPKVEPPKMVKVKVDGEEFEVSQAEVDEAGGVSAYQKGKAADNRLKKANEAIAETRKMQAAIAQWAQSQVPQKPQETDDQFMASKIDVIRFGTPEESAAALKEVMSRNRIDPNAVVQQATSVMQQNMALANFKKEFQDVVSNQILLRAAVSLEQERRAKAGPDTDWDTFYRQIGNEVRSVIGRPSQPAVVATQDPGTTSQDSKEARKASIVNLPTAAARAALPTEEKPETREDILNKMRKTRGIPTG